MQEIQSVLTKGKDYVRGWTDERGILSLIAVVAVPVKIFLFYFFMGISANFVPVWLITTFLVYLLFSSFENKWIPAVVYLIITLIMFADVTYFSFFNRYLSVNMLGAARFLADVTASILAVLKPKFFLMFVDSILIFTVLIRSKIMGRDAFMLGSGRKEDLHKSQNSKMPDAVFGAKKSSGLPLASSDLSDNEIENGTHWEIPTE